MITSLFQHQFISQSMHQLFNRAGARKKRNHNAPPQHKHLRLNGQL